MESGTENAKLEPCCINHLRYIVIGLLHMVLEEEQCCIQTIADLMFLIRMSLPAFESDQVGDTRKMNVARILLVAVQDEFDTIEPELPMPVDEATHDNNERVRNRSIALSMFIGHLHVRQLLAPRVMAQVMHDLVGVRDRTPQSHLVECACELLLVIGPSLDATGQGNMLMTQFLARMSNLASTKKKRCC